MIAQMAFNLIRWKQTGFTVRTFSVATALLCSFFPQMQKLAWGQEVMGKVKKAELIEFMKEFKRVVEIGAFSDPQKLNEIIPMKIEWREPEEIPRSTPWMIARTVLLNTSLFPSDQLDYRVQKPDRWTFSIRQVNQIACVTFDEMTALWGSEYQLAPTLYRHYKSGSTITRPGPQKMAGEGVIYLLAVPGYEKRVSLRMSFDGCLESFGAWQVIETNKGGTQK